MPRHHRVAHLVRVIIEAVTITAGSIEEDIVVALNPNLKEKIDHSKSTTETREGLHEGHDHLVGITTDAED